MGRRVAAVGTLMIAVCLLTCDRPELTEMAARTVALDNQGRKDIAWLHCDGGSMTTENMEHAAGWGFLTLLYPPSGHRIGQMVTLNAFVDRAQRLGAEWIAWLENDWESVAPLPSQAFLDATEADTVRLFGVRKMRSGHRILAGTRRLGTDEPITWTPARSGWESGRAHWGGGGTLIRTMVLARQRYLPRLKDIMEVENNLTSLRPVENLWWCNGVVSTPNILCGAEA